MNFFCAIFAQVALIHLTSAAASVPKPEVVFDTEIGGLVYQFFAHADGMRHAVENSPDLTSWEIVFEPSETSLDAGGEAHFVIADSTISPALFLRLKTTNETPVEVPPTDPNIRYVGRFDLSEAAAPRMYWSGTHLVAWFEGDKIDVRLNSTKGDDYFNIMIDDGEPLVVDLEPGSQTIEISEGLGGGRHKITVFKRTSYQKDDTAFEGFVTYNGQGLSPPDPVPAVKIEFYGDSITDGKSVDAVGDSDAAEFWNNYLTYAAVTARNLEMEFVSIASSGIAVKHPWSMGFVMGNYYDRLNPGDPSSEWDFSHYTPDIVVINLLQNDAFKKAPPHDAATRDGILKAYKDLVRSIRAKYPEAEIICALGNMSACRPDLPWAGYLETAVEDLEAAGDTRLHSLIFSFAGVWHHPNAAHHAPMAEQLTAYIETNLSHLFE